MPRGNATLNLYIMLYARRYSQFSTETARCCASFEGLLWHPQSRLDRRAFVLEVFEGDYQGIGIPETAIGVVSVTPHAQPSDNSEAPFHAMVHLARSNFDAALRLVDVIFDEVSSFPQLLPAELGAGVDPFMLHDDDAGSPSRNLP
jgi:hypothetical protein